LVVLVMCVAIHACLVHGALLAERMLLESIASGLDQGKTLSWRTLSLVCTVVAIRQT